MRIDNRSSGEPNPRIDLTRPTREAIQTEAAKDAAAKTAKDSEPDVDQASLHKRAKHARAKLKEGMLGDKLDPRITGARGRYNDKIEFRDRVKGARERMGTDISHGPDKLQISPEAALLSETTIAPRPEVSAAMSSRADQLSELKSLSDSGKLNTDDLIARAAHRMLGGE